MIKLYTYFRSSASYRVRIALNLKGMEYEPEIVHLPSGEQRGEAYRNRNPQGLVPALEDEDGTVLTQSIAIMEYIDEIRPEPPLMPHDMMERGQVRAMSLLIACDIHPLNNLQVLKYLKSDMDQEQDAVDNWYRHWVGRGFTGLEAMVQKYGGTYCFGDQVSMADVCLVPQMFNARRFDTDLGPFPKLVEIDERLRALEAFEKAAPENQPDAQ